MKIEKGMYCYDKTNRKVGIGKIIGFLERNNVLIEYKNNVNFVSKGNVVASFNLIDLIEVGDYVNGEKVTSAEPVDKKDIERYLGFGYYDYYIHNSEDIKDIVTKEQFEASKYIVERATNE